MGSYLFERSTSDGAGREAGQSLQDDVMTALREIDWVDNFNIHADRSSDERVSVDVIFDAEWPDVRTSNPDQVAEVFDRLGLRTVTDTSLANPLVSTDDPLSVAETLSADDVSFDLFAFDE